MSNYIVIAYKASQKRQREELASASELDPYGFATVTLTEPTPGADDIDSTGKPRKKVRQRSQKPQLVTPLQERSIQTQQVAILDSQLQAQDIDKRLADIEFRERKVFQDNRENDLRERELEFRIKQIEWAQSHGL